MAVQYSYLVKAIFCQRTGTMFQFVHCGPWGLAAKAEAAVSGQTDYSLSPNEIVELIPAMRAFARTFYRDINDADDLVQITLVRALGSLHQFEPGTSLKSWLFTIMRNAFYTKVKIDAREAPGKADCISVHPATDATQEWSVRGKEVAVSISRLPEKQREVIMLVGVLGVSYEEASVVCHCAIGTIKSRLNRACARLLEELSEDVPRASREY